MAKNRVNKKDLEEREMAFKSLPPSVRNTLTDEEKDLFLHAEVWPDTLFEKLSEFIINQSDE
jgi:hypothetical protein